MIKSSLFIDVWFARYLWLIEIMILISDFLQMAPLEVLEIELLFSLQLWNYMQLKLLVTILNCVAV